MKRKITLFACLAAVTAIGAFWLSVLERHSKGGDEPRQSSSASGTPAASKAHELAMLTEQLKRKPGHAPVLLRMAELEQQGGKPAKAVEYLRELLNSDPANRDARLELGRALYNAGDAQGALAETRRLIEADPKNVDALYNLGAIYANLSDFGQARLAWLEAVRVAANSESGKRAAAGLTQIPGASSTVAMQAAGGSK